MPAGRAGQEAEPHGRGAWGCQLASAGRRWGAPRCRGSRGVFVLPASCQRAFWLWWVLPRPRRWLGQRKKEERKGWRAAPSAKRRRAAPCFCSFWPQDGTLKLYKELGARSIKVTFHPSPASSSREARREAGRGEESWRPPGRFLAPTAWGPAVPLGGQGSQRPTEPLLSNAGIAVWSSARPLQLDLRLCFLNRQKQ